MPHGIGNRADLSRQGVSDGPALRLPDLGPVWAAWEDHGEGKPPLNPRTGRMASTTNPATWGTKAQAEARAAKLGGKHPLGIGVMLHTLPDWPAWALAGVDLDGCRDPETGEVAWWAQAVVDLLGAYVETSPSGRGLHVLLFVRIADVEALRAEGLIRPDPRTGEPGAGRAFGLKGGHRELAFFAERKFLTYTASPLPGHDLIRPVGLADLRWLLGEHGPAVLAREGAREARGGGQRGAAGGLDGTGSGAAARFLLAAFLAGADEEAAREAAAEDAGEAGDWWGRVDDRQHDRAVTWAQEEAAQRRGALLKDFDMIERMDTDERDLEAALQEVVFLPPEGSNGGALAPAAPLRSREREAADRRAPYSDTWAGAFFADLWRGKRLYVSATEQWLMWTGERWVAMTAEDVMAGAKATSTALLAREHDACAKNPSTENQGRVRMAAKLHGSSAALMRMVESARSEPGMHVATPAEFDRDPYTLATASGLVNLRTGECRPARPEDMVSKLAGVGYDPVARAPLWEAFLLRVQPDPEVRAFLQRAVGYTLTGDVGEERFLLLHGTGSNGKSTFGNTIGAVLGEYASQFGGALVTQKRDDNEASRMVAKLPGLRLAQVDETAQGAVFDAARVKSLSSREPLFARRLYAEGFDFQPTHHLWIRTNHLPGSLDASDGFWRRCIPVPFTVSIPEEERVGDFDRRIIREELAGVLAWAVRGAVAWAQEGRLRVPDSLKAVAAQYRQDTDLLGQWLAERTARDPNGTMTTKDAYHDFREFCDGMGVSAGSQIAFGRNLADRNVEKGRDTSRRGFRGIRLLPRFGGHVAPEAEESWDDVI